jgi:hypothetical protein
MKKFLTLTLAAFLLFFYSCEDETFTVPSITPPTDISVAINDVIEITFEYTAEGGFSTAGIEATKGTATVKTNGISGSASGAIVVLFAAGMEAGAGSVVLTVTDQENQTVSSTAIVDVKKGISVNSNITASTTWKTGKVYILESRITVISGVTLTIQPGVIVKGEAGTGSNATALMIARGGKLDAQGTATSPIIFTSVSDDILPGQIASPNLSSDLDGLWGGLIILGNAPISASSSPKQIEGIPPSDQNGLYGGTDPADNSGIIKYVSIRHGGANIGEGNEINGLTLGGVGSGTLIENIEVIANQDDGIEWFGGTVNVKNALVWNAGDDAIDTDQAWAGTLDNFIVITPSDKCFEIDGPEGAMQAGHTIKNGSVQAGSATGLVDLDNVAGSTSNSIVVMDKIFFFGLSATITQTFDDNPAGLTASNLEIILPTGKTLQQVFLKGTDAFATAVTARNMAGADKAVFNTWSWTSAAGKLSAF